MIQATFSFKKCQKPVNHWTTEGPSIELIGYRMLQHESNSGTFLFTPGINEQTCVSLYMSISWLVVKISACKDVVAKGLIKWRSSARPGGLKFCCDYMTNFSPDWSCDVHLKAAQCKTYIVSFNQFKLLFCTDSFTDLKSAGSFRTFDWNPCTPFEAVQCTQDHVLVSLATTLLLSSNDEVLENFLFFS